MKILSPLLLFLLVFSSLHAFSQKTEKTIVTGRVIDLDRNPVPHALIMLDGEKSDVTTNSKGYYRIRIPSYISRIGVINLGNGIIEEDIAGRNVINFYFNNRNIKPVKIHSGTDVLVNTGYNKLKKKNLTVPVTRVEGNNSGRTYRSIYEMLQGVPGVRVMGRNIVVQDSRDLMGYVPPLMLVDGLPTGTIDDIVPSNVKSIEVLKGPAAAIYGSRAYGGVILITLKSYDSE